MQHLDPSLPSVEALVRRTQRLALSVALASTATADWSVVAYLLDAARVAADDVLATVGRAVADGHVPARPSRSVAGYAAAQTAVRDIGARVAMLASQLPDGDLPDAVGRLAHLTMELAADTLRLETLLGTRRLVAATPRKRPFRESGHILSIPDKPRQPSQARERRSRHLSGMTGCGRICEMLVGVVATGESLTGRMGGGAPRRRARRSPRRPGRASSAPAPR